MSQKFQTAVIAACKEHKNQNRKNHDYRACVYVGEHYFVKHGAPKDLEPERATQEYIFNHAQQSQFPVSPRVPKILHHFVHERTMYLVMERITLQETPPDLARIQAAVKWLSKVPLPSDPTLGPVGSGCIRHRFFKEFKAPFNFLDTATLDQYMAKAYDLLSSAARQTVSPVKVSGERLMFAQSDMDISNFGIDEKERTVLMDFGEVGLLPETFVAHTLSSDETFHSIVDALGLSGNSKVASMAAIAQCLGMASNPKLGMVVPAAKIRRRA